MPSSRRRWRTCHPDPVSCADLAVVEAIVAIQRGQGGRIYGELRWGAPARWAYR